MSDAGEEETQTSRPRIGLLYDERMCAHHTPDEENHPENPDRLRAIWKLLLHHDIPQKCVLLDAEFVDEKYLLGVHSKEHVKLIKNISSKQYASRRNKIASKLNSIYFNEGSSESALLACGSVVMVSEKVATGELNSAAALVRPPGHHAENNEPMGFCLLNNVAVAAKFLIDEKPELGIKKILIVDWDVHHGNGTQKMFYEDPRVLFFSVHRHEHGLFYPGTSDGSYDNIGEGNGVGYNINVPWENGRCGDADYFAAWDHILIPIAKEFNPDIILISAGFDAAIGDPLGWCRVSPYGYSVLLNKLLEFAEGKVVLALEGGYNLDSIAKSFHACMEALLHKKPIFGSVNESPFDTTWNVIQQVRKELSPYWPSLATELPHELTNKSTSYLQTMSSYSDSEEEIDSISKPLADLKVNDSGLNYSEIDVWYAAYGSNMWLPRFLCYIEGDKGEGGSIDKTPIKETCWKVFPRRLFFAESRSSKWGDGAVAFLHIQSNESEKAHLCLYKISLQQFRDVMLQENGKSVSDSEFAFESTWLETFEKKGFLEVFKHGRYGNVGYLGEKDGLPILTLTCCWSALEQYISRQRPRCPPSPDYVDVLLKGLLQGNQMSRHQAVSYIHHAATTPL